MSATTLAFAIGIAIVATGLVTGVFLAFSDFVMRSFARIPPEAGSEVMQVINREVFRSVFITLLIGMTLYSVLIAGYALVLLDGPAVAWLVAGGACYFFGTFAVTMLCNVPMNERLATMDHTASATHDYWRFYAERWTRWNTVRTVAPLLTMICFTVALYHVAREAGAATIGS